MGTEIEAAADVVSGAALARAIEPAQGEAGGQTGTGTGATADGDARACLNCSAPISGPYCSQCGQKAVVHRTLGAFGHDLAHSVLHFDGKIWRTLPLLALRPGELTRRYVHGERAKFVSPLALFLFTVFLMFAAFSLLGPSLNANEAIKLDSNQTEFTQEIVKLKAEARLLDAARADQRALGLPTTKLDSAAANVRDMLDRIDTPQSPGQLAELIRTGTDAERILAEAKGARLETAIAKAQREGRTDAALRDQREAKRLKEQIAAQGRNLAAGEAFGSGEVNTGWPALDEAIRSALEDPKLLIYKMQSSAYKFSWALIPLSVPFLWLLYAWRRQYKLFDHAVFVTYSLCFMMMLFTLCVLLLPYGALGGLAALAMVLVPPIHFYKQLRGAYGSGRGGAMLRTMLLMLFSGLVLLLFGTLILALGMI